MNMNRNNTNVTKVIMVLRCFLKMVIQVLARIGSHRIKEDIRCMRWYTSFASQTVGGG